MLPGEYLIYGADPSYFTRMVEAAMRYMRIPHRALPKSPDVRDRLEARAGTHLIPVVETPEGWVIHDSTYIIQLLDMRYPDRPVIPRSPAQRILCRVLDDWIDEWFTRAALHFRWVDDDGAREGALAIAHDLAGAPKDRKPDDGEMATVQAVADMILPWGRKAMGVMAAGPDHQDQLRAEFAAFLKILEAHFAVIPALFGERLSLADLKTLGAMKAHFAADSVAKAFVTAQAPGLLDWTGRAWERVAGDETWLDADAIPESLEPLFPLLLDGFGRFLPENRKAVEAGEKWTHFMLEGKPVRMFTRPDAEKSRQAVMAEIAAMSQTDARAAGAALASRGLAFLYED
ncbi:MAG: glutathione S-transferase [Oceanicaulis sp.]|nr:glutathione S-transferase [Oceanicaulis sp.]